MTRDMTADVPKEIRMTAPDGSRCGALTRLAGLTLATIFMLALAVVPAMAAEATATPIQKLQRGPLLSFTCNDCHAQISDTKVPGLIFSHGAHMSYNCTSCHPRFPHTPSGTTRPAMASCFSCHGLRHGPQGIIAAPECSKCHVKPRAALKPADHGAGFKGEPHVLAAQSDLRSRCMLCHTKGQCDSCHNSAKVSWETTQSFSFDAGNGCLSCHKSELPRLAAPVTASKLDSSAHRDLTCTQCHPDFRHDDAGGSTKLWKINAGLACGECHEKQEKEWAGSIHGAKLLSGDNLDAASCGGCHGGHDIERLKTDAAKKRLYLSGEQTCVSRCHVHEDEYASYGDWWHGSAYKAGTADAPACWTCHGAHGVLAVKDPKNMTSSEQLPKTCGQTDCHRGSGESFAEGGRALPHGRIAAVEQNPITLLRAALFGRR